MTSFFNKLKEQASSFQAIAKNMIVYDNTNDNDNDDDSEIAEKLDDEITGQNNGKSGVGKKISSNNVKDQSDDFFN